MLNDRQDKHFLKHKKDKLFFKKSIQNHGKNRDGLEFLCAEIKYISF